MKATGGLLLLAGQGWRVCAAGAVNVAGQWRAEFESPRGPQKERFAFQAEADTLTGWAAVEVGVRKCDAEFKDIKLVNDTLTLGALQHQTNREHRSLAGLSGGGGQSLNRTFFAEQEAGK